MENQITVPSSVNSVDTAVNAAKNFETLGITGVLFLVILGLFTMLIFKSKSDNKMADLTGKVGEMVIVTKSSTDAAQAVNSANMSQIMQQLDTIKDMISNIEKHIIDLRVSAGNRNRRDDDQNY